MPCPSLFDLEVAAKPNSAENRPGLLDIFGGSGHSNPMRFLFQWLVVSLTILMIPNVLSGIQVDSFGAALAAAAVLGVLNALVRPVLVVLTFPLTLLTLGLFLVVINALMFRWAGAIVSGVHVDGFLSAILASLIVSLVSWLTSVKRDKTGPQARIQIIRPNLSQRTVRDLN